MAEGRVVPELPLPRSIDRLIRFVDDLERASQPILTIEPSMVLGASKLASQIASRPTLSTLSVRHPMAELMIRYSLVAGDLADLVRWLVLWRDLRDEPLPEGYDPKNPSAGVQPRSAAIAEIVRRPSLPAPIAEAVPKTGPLEGAMGRLLQIAGKVGIGASLTSASLAAAYRAGGESAVAEHLVTAMPKPLGAETIHISVAPSPAPATTHAQGLHYYRPPVPQSPAASLPKPPVASQPAGAPTEWEPVPTSERTQSNWFDTPPQAERPLVRPPLPEQPDPASGPSFDSRPSSPSPIQRQVEPVRTSPITKGDVPASYASPSAPEAQASSEAAKPDYRPFVLQSVAAAMAIGGLVSLTQHHPHRQEKEEKRESEGKEGGKPREDRRDFLNSPQVRSGEEMTPQAEVAVSRRMELVRVQEASSPTGMASSSNETWKTASPFLASPATPNQAATQERPDVGREMVFPSLLAAKAATRTVDSLRTQINRNAVGPRPVANPAGAGAEEFYQEAGELLHLAAASPFEPAVEQSTRQNLPNTHALVHERTPAKQQPAFTERTHAGRAVAKVRERQEAFLTKPFRPMTLRMEGPDALPPAPRASNEDPAPFAREQSPAFRAEHGMITLVAPPLVVASSETEQSGAGVQFGWDSLAQGAGALDAGGLARLTAALPPGARAIYPAIGPSGLGRSMINLRLAPSLLSDFLTQSYGPDAADKAGEIGLKAAEWSSSPVSRPLAGNIVPTKRPIASAGAVFSAGAKPGMGELERAGEGQAARGGALDFLGIPVRVAPSLGGNSELGEEVAIRSAASALSSGSAVRPQIFGPLRDRLFPAFQSVVAEPDQQAWRQAAPSFGLRDDRPSTIFSPGAKSRPRTTASPLPPSPMLPSVGGTPGAAFGGHLERMNPMLAGLSGGLPSISSGSSSVGDSLPSAPTLPHTGGRSGLAFPSSEGGFGGRTFSASSDAGWDSPQAEPSGASSGGFRSPGMPQRTGGASSPGIFEPADIPPAVAPASVRGTHPPLRPPALESVDFSSPYRESPAQELPSVGRAMDSMPRITGRAISSPMSDFRPPQLLYAANQGVQDNRNRHSAGSVIQRSTGSVMPASEEARKMSQASKPLTKTGSRGAEVQSLANEVWTLLRRRLTNEAERRGRW